jgi:hypothetical protein
VEHLLTSIPKKKFKEPRSFTANSLFKEVSNLGISNDLEHKIMISSTYIKRKSLLFGPLVKVRFYSIQSKYDTSAKNMKYEIE